MTASEMGYVLGALVGVLIPIAIVVHWLVGALRGKPNKPGMVEVVDTFDAPVDPNSKGLEGHLDELLPHAPDKHWYRKPNIPPRKLTKALVEYAPELKPEQVLVLADGTFFGSAKRGCLLTKEAIHYKSSGGQGRVTWGEIEKAERVGGFPNYWIDIWLNDDEKVRISCDNFEGVRNSLEEFINRLVAVDDSGDNAAPERPSEATSTPASFDTGESVSERLVGPRRGSNVCAQCGGGLEYASRFCPYCGTRQEDHESNEQRILEKKRERILHLVAFAQSEARRGRTKRQVFDYLTSQGVPPRIATSIVDRGFASQPEE